MSRAFFREKSIYGLNSAEAGILENRSKVKIAVVGIGRGAGATFVAMNLALSLGETEGGTVYLEGRQHNKDEMGAFRLLSVDPKFRALNFIDYFANGEVVAENGVSRLILKREPGVNLYKGVNWIVRNPASCLKGQSGSDAFEVDSELIYGKYLVVDNPNDFDKSGAYDILIAVVDPLPSRVMCGLSRYKRVRRIENENRYTKVMYLLNKSVGNRCRRNTEKFLKIKFDYDVQMLGMEDFYEAQLNCTQPYFTCPMLDFKRIAEGIFSIFHFFSI